MTLQELEENFGTQEQCLAYLHKLRWANGPSCVDWHTYEIEGRNEWKRKQEKEMAATEYTVTKNYGFYCPICRQTYSVLRDTVFQDTQLKLLPLWFRAVWYITSQDSGTSALELQRFLGLGSYRTAWTWLQKLRKIMYLPKLQGTVMVDTFSIMVNGEYGLEEKYPVLIALEVDPNRKAIKQIRMSNIDYNDCNEVSSFIEKCVTPSDNVLRSNGRIDFSKLDTASYPQEIERKGGRNFQPTREVISYLEKKKLLGVLPSMYSKEHLSHYLDECCFKFNKRSSKDKGFYDILENAVSGANATFIRRKKQEIMEQAKPRIVSFDERQEKGFQM